MRGRGVAVRERCPGSASGRRPPEDRRGELARLIGDSGALRAVGITALRAALASPGDFREVTAWPFEPAASAPALIVMSDPLEYRPEDDPGGARLGAANLGTWGGTAWRARFGPGAAATWCGCCTWAGFVVFVGVAHQRAGGTARIDCEAIRERTIAALPHLHVSRSGSEPTWLSAEETG